MAKVKAKQLKYKLLIEQIRNAETRVELAQCKTMIDDDRGESKRLRAMLTAELDKRKTVLDGD